jgi:hypothetical protein
LLQRCCDADDGTLTVQVKEPDTGTTCTGGTMTGTFHSDQTALCSNCTNPGTCGSNMCHNCP